MSFNLRERQALQLIHDEYQAKGYQVFLYPPDDLLPSSLRSLRPDAVAIKDGEKIAFEVVLRRSDDKDRRLANMAESVAASGWRLSVVYAPDQTDIQYLMNIKVDSIESKLTEIGVLIENGHRSAALLLAWGILEAASRLKAQSEGISIEGTLAPRQLTETLVTYGWISQSEGQAFRELAKTRNAVAHGFEGNPKKDQLDLMVGIIIRLSQAERTRPSARDA